MTSSTLESAVIPQIAFLVHDGGQRIRNVTLLPFKLEECHFDQKVNVWPEGAT